MISVVSSPGAIQKPTVFISHATTDEPVATALRTELDRIFSRGLDVFQSSSPEAIPPGSDWLGRIRGRLDTAHAVIVIITPTSINRPWIWFEVGASWSRMEEDKGRIYPVCVPEVDIGSLPEPLSRLQAVSLGQAAGTRQFFEALVAQFGFGQLQGFRHAAFKGRLPKYSTIKLDQHDIGRGELYNGPYVGYSEEELREVIQENFISPKYETAQNSLAWGPPGSDNIFGGELVHYREVDTRYALPPGTAKRLLIDEMKRYGARVVTGHENVVRFGLTAKGLRDLTYK